jgi:hypothetical protein
MTTSFVVPDQDRDIDMDLSYSGFPSRNPELISHISLARGSQ